MTITQRVQIHLNIKGVSKAELARRLEVSPQTINTILKKDDIKFSTLERIADAIGIKVKDFLEDTLEIA